MNTSHAEILAVRDVSELEHRLGDVESQLNALGDALKLQDASAAERAAAGLHQALAQAVDRFSQAARHGGVPPALRRRLALTGGQVAAQRDAVARASNALDRAIDLLMPGSAPGASGGLYGAQGGTARSVHSGLARA